MAANTQTALRTEGFINSLGVDTHMDYTDGAYANEANVASDLAYLGVSNIRDSVPDLAGGIPAQNQITALHKLADAGIKFDLLVDAKDADLPAEMVQLNALESYHPGSIIAVEGPNEINNWPVTYPGLTGQAAATALQKNLYGLVHGDTALKGVSVYDFTGGTASPQTPYGVITKEASGSYLLVNGITGWPVALPVGVSTISITYTGANPGAGLFYYPGQGQVGGITYGANGKLTFTYDNTGTAPLKTYISVSDWNATTTITDVSAVSGKSGNLVVFDPNLSLTGLADDANIHPYPSHGGQPGANIPANYLGAFGSTTPGPRVITEDGYNTDTNSASGVSQAVQAQDDVKILLDAYSSGVSTTYLYELLDEKSDPTDANSEMHYGLFNYDNTPKLAATAIHNLTTILADTGSSAKTFTPSTLAWSATNLPTTAKTMLTEKSNGAFDLAIWNEPATEGLATVTLNLGATYKTVKVFDPITHSVASETFTDVSKISLNLRDNALIIEVEPGLDTAKTSADTTKAAITSAAVGTSKSMAFVASTAKDASTPAARQIFAATTTQDLTAAAASLNLWHTAQSGGGGFWSQGMHQFTASSGAIPGRLTQHDTSTLTAAQAALLRSPHGGLF
jgi:hypothetical protein